MHLISSPVILKVCLFMGTDGKKRDGFSDIYYSLFEDYKILSDLVSFQTI